MARIRDYKITEQNSVTTHTAELPDDYEEDDLLLLVLTRLDALNGDVVAPSGWSELSVTLNRTGNWTHRTVIFYKIAGASESNPSTTLGTAKDYYSYIFSIMEVDTTTPIDTTLSDTESNTSFTLKIYFPALTTVNDDSLIIPLVTISGFRAPLITPWGNLFDTALATNGANSIQVAMGVGYKPTAGALPDTKFIVTSGHGSALFGYLVINNDTAPDKNAYLKPGTSIKEYNLYTNAAAGSPVPSVNGVNISNRVDDTCVVGILQSHPTFTMRNMREMRLDAGSGCPAAWTDGEYLGEYFMFNDGAQDFSASPYLSVNFENNLEGLSVTPNAYGIADNGIVFIAIDTSGNWRAWTIGGYDEISVFTPDNPYCVDLSNSTDELDSSVTAIDLTDVEGIMVILRNDEKGEINLTKSLQQLHTAVFVGGTSSSPVDFDLISDTFSWQHTRLASFQGTVQQYLNQPIQIGDSSDYVYSVLSGGVIEFFELFNSSTNKSNNLPDNYTGITYYPDADSTIEHKDAIITGVSKFHWDIHASSSGSATVDFSGLQIKGPGRTSINVFTLTGVTFSGRDELTLGTGSLSGGCTIDNTNGTQAVTVTSQADLDKLANCTFSNNAIAIQITGDQTSLTFDAIMFSGNTVDVKYTGDTNVTITLSNGSNASTKSETGLGTVTFSQPGTGILFSNVENGSQVVVYETGTTTEKHRTNSSSGGQVDWDTTGDQGNVDYTIRKAGKIFIRETNVAVGANKLTLSGTAADDPIYTTSSGLTHSTDTSYNAGTNRFSLSKDSTIRNWYSAMVEFFISESAYNNVAFPLQAYGYGTVALLDDAEFVADSHVEYLYRGAPLYLDSSDVITAEWVSVQSVGAASGFTGEYQQVAGGTVTDALTTGPFDQTIKVYGDASHGNFNYRSHLVLKFQPDGYRPVEADVYSLFDSAALFARHYVIAMQPEAISGASTGDPGISGVSITNHGATPVTWQSLDFSITITDTGSNTGADILQWLRYHCSLDATFQGQDPFNWPEMVVPDGSKYKTERGTLWGSAGATLKGVRVVDGSGNPHPDFSTMMADDGSVYNVPVLATGSVTGMPTTGADIRLQVVNETGRTASAWQASTAYTEGDYVLRTTGVGSENVAGLFFVCTTAGTSGGTEPTWDTTAGNTTNDGTVVWTTRNVQFYSGDPAGTNYSDTYTDGEEFAAGDTVRIRFAELDGATSFKLFSQNAVAAASGWSVAVDEVADDVYATNATDGSVITKFTADFTDNEIDLSANANFTAAEAYAFYCYQLTTATGIHQFWGGVEAPDVGNYKIVTSVLSLYFDNTATASKRQTDSARIYRDDDAYPVKDPTTSGYGIDMNWQNVVYAYATSSGITAGDKNDIINGVASSSTITGMESDIDEIHKDMGLDSGNAKTITENTEGEDYTEVAGSITKTVVKSGSTTTITRSP